MTGIRMSIRTASAWVRRARRTASRPSADGATLWAANATSNDLTSFRVGRDGALSQRGPSVAVGANGPAAWRSLPTAGGCTPRSTRRGTGPGFVVALAVGPERIPDANR